VSLADGGGLDGLTSANQAYLLQFELPAPTISLALKGGSDGGVGRHARDVAISSDDWLAAEELLRHTLDVIGSQLLELSTELRTAVPLAIVHELTSQVLAHDSAALKVEEERGASHVDSARQLLRLYSLAELLELLEWKTKGLGFRV
jgi:hypothetical protein